MANMEELKRTFFDECSELLQEIEAGLTDLREARAPMTPCTRSSAGSIR